MSIERKQRLDDIGFVWEPAKANWEEGFSNLLQFKEANGHCGVPVGYKLEGFALGVWVATQRVAKDSISPERQQRLNDIGFVWDVFAEQWEEGFSNLLKFKEANAHCRVPHGFKLAGFSLGRWVHRQRAAKDSMTAERRQRLDDIGFVWAPSKDKT